MYKRGSSTTQETKIEKDYQKWKFVIEIFENGSGLW